LINSDLILPSVGACVVHFADEGKKHLGRVVSISSEGDLPVRVHWFARNETEWLEATKLRSGFMPGMDVLEVPSSPVLPSMGEGVVIRSRLVAGHEQVLVQFPDTGEVAWLPWQNLCQVKGVKHRYILGEQDGEHAAERLRLRTLAWALKLWNENTGALARFDIDPLPHQIHLVHHILASGDLNWLIADDVGLGKTIETGLLLAALRQRKQAKRILLITPAGLTKQWQEELYFKFGMGDFRIYGDDFSITEPRHWKMYDCVIGSLDRFKNENHLELLLQAEPWDLVIFDEAHRLTRRQYGMKYASSQRFDLAREIRSRTESILLLTATPHQGQQDSFAALLELLHPERKEELLTLSINPEILQDMVFRNRKADVTDLEGNFVFQGKTTRALKVPISESAHEFDKALQSYLKKGYQAGEARGMQGRAIGFVMTVYRKLAASSIASIHDALVRRRKRLKKELTSIPDDQFDRRAALESLDRRFEGESEESVTASTQGEEFFVGEIDLLNQIIGMARELKAEDRKLQLFLDEVVATVLNQNPDEKILVFSEYRGTQEWLLDALNRRFGQRKTVLINGSMDLSERRRAIASFETDAQFLLSTEAGGEGINLQQRCHIMVNYDLPWNPMRLVQRIGRLYRYGQKKRVVVFNIHSPDTLDEQIINILYSRLDQVVADMAPVGEEYNDSMKDDVLGEIADLVEVEDILAQASKDSISRTTERIDEALAKARGAAEIQRQLFDHVAGFNAEEMQGNLNLDESHLRAFIGGMFAQLGIETQDTTHKGQVWQVKLPEEIMRAAGTRRSRHAICFDRELAASRDDLQMMDTGSWLLDYLFRAAVGYEFQGKTAVTTGLKDTSTLFGTVLRWQDQRGRRMRQEFAAITVDGQGKVNANDERVNHWLLGVQGDMTITQASDKSSNEDSYKLAEATAFSRLASLSTRKLVPDSIQWVSAAWSLQK
jgi:ERCC4-related helicase